MKNYYTMSQLKLTKLSSIRLLVLGVFILIMQSAYAQMQTKWTKDFSLPIRWQEVTTLGNFIVNTSTELSAIDPATGEALWSKPALGGLNRANYRELPNSPFFSAEKGNNIQIIDQLSGDVVFDASTAGISLFKDSYFLFQNDGILVSGQDGANEPVIVFVKMSTGEVQWKVNEDFKRIVTVNEISNQEILVVTLFKVYKINSKSGEIAWKQSTSSEVDQMESMGAFGALVKAAAETVVADEEIDVRFFRPSGSDYFYLGSQQEIQSSMTSSSGQATFNYENVFYAYNISDGKRVWKKELRVKGKLSQVSFQENGLLILPDDGNRTKINLFNYQTQEGIWGKKGKGLPIKGGIYDYLDAGIDGMLLVSQTTSGNFLNYLNTDLGMITFDKPVKVDGRVLGIVPLSQNILYITDESLNILDKTAGALKWKKGLKTAPSVIDQKADKLYLFDYKSNTIKTVDKSSEALTDFTTTPLEFEGKEAPSKLSVVADGILVSSDQNIAKYDMIGGLIFQSYYPAPREPGWKRALLYAEAARGAYIGASSYMVSSSIEQSSADIHEQDAVAGVMVDAIGDAYEELGDQASAYAKSSIEQANARFKATKAGRDFIFILASIDKDLKLLKVSKTTGESEGAVDLGKDKEPVYAIDAVTGQVFYADGTTLKSYIAE